jgi:uncharacterized protein (DUF433 family)
MPRYRRLSDWLLTHADGPSVRAARRSYEHEHGSGSWRSPLWQYAPLDGSLGDSARSLRQALTSRLYHSVGVRVRVWALRDRLAVSGLPVPELHQHFDDLVRRTVPIGPADGQYIGLLFRVVYDPQHSYGGPVLRGHRAPALPLIERRGVGGAPAELTLPPAEAHVRGVRARFRHYADRNHNALAGMGREYVRQLNTVCVAAVRHAVEPKMPTERVLSAAHAVRVAGLADDYDETLGRALDRCFFRPLANVFAAVDAPPPPQLAADTLSPRMRAAIEAAIGDSMHTLREAAENSSWQRGAEPSSALDMTLPQLGAVPIFSADLGLLNLDVRPDGTPRQRPGASGTANGTANGHIERVHGHDSEACVAQLWALLGARLESIVQQQHDAARIAPFVVRASHFRDTMRDTVERAQQELLVFLVWDDETQSEYRTANAGSMNPAQSPLWAVHLVWNRAEYPWVEVYEPVEPPSSGWAGVMRMFGMGAAPVRDRVPHRTGSNGQVLGRTHARAMADAVCDSGGSEREAALRSTRLLTDMTVGFAEPRPRAAELAYMLAAHTRGARNASLPQADRVFQVYVAPQIDYRRAHEVPWGGAHAPGYPLTYCMWYAEMRMRSATLSMCTRAFVESLHGPDFDRSWLRGTYYRRLWSQHAEQNYYGSGTGTGKGAHRESDDGPMCDMPAAVMVTHYEGSTGSDTSESE